MTIKQLKKQERRLFFENGRLLYLILTGIFFVFLCFFPLLLNFSLSGLLLGEAELAETAEPSAYRAVVTILLTVMTVAAYVFLTVPAWMGLYSVADCIRRGERPDFLAPFRRERYLPSLLSGLLFALRGAAVVLIAALVAYLPYIADSHLSSLFFGFVFLSAFSWLSLPMGVGAAFLMLILTSGWFLAPYLMTRGRRVGEAFAESRRLMRGKKGRYAAFLASFLGLILLSVLSVGVLWILYTLPLMLMTYFSLAASLCDNQQTM